MVDEKLLTKVDEVVMKVTGVKAENLTISFGTSRSIVKQGGADLLGYWLCEGIGGVVIYKAQQVWAYFVNVEPFISYGKRSAYVINEDSAVEWIEAHGGWLSPLYEATVKAIRGDALQDITIREHNAWLSETQDVPSYYDYGWYTYRVYSGPKGVSLYSCKDVESGGQHSWGSGAAWHRLNNDSIAKFYDDYSKSVVGDEWVKLKLKGKAAHRINNASHNIYERKDDSVLLPDVLAKFRNIALMKSI